MLPTDPAPRGRPPLPAARHLALAALVLLAIAAPAPRAAAAVPASWDVQDEATFAILQGDHRLGTEDFRIYTSNDTLITASTVILDGAGPDSRLPTSKRTTFLRRAYDSYPLLFQAIEVGRDTTRTVALNCVFVDTAAVIYTEADGRGTGESVALPPGRLYILEPGVYLPVQLLAADFLAGSQDQRKQPVLIPSLRQVIDLYLTRGATETIHVAGRTVPTTRVELTDRLTPLVAWLDADGRMWRLEAPNQGLRVERAPRANKVKRRTVAPGR